MISFQTWAPVLLATVVILKIIQSIIKTSRLRSIMPPGPSGLPLFGNVFQIGSLKWLTLTRWKERYGPIFSLNFAGQPVVVINDLETTADLLDRRSNIYSGRPRFIMGGEILTGGLFFALMPYNDLWRRLRRGAHEGLSGRAAVAYQPLQEKESAILALNLLQDPERWNDHLGRSTASTMLSLTYGWSWVDAGADALVKRIDDFGHHVSYACAPGNYLVDTFPSMLYLPEWMARWKREGKGLFKQYTDMFIGLLDDVKTKMQAGASEPCFSAMLTETEDKHGLSTKEAAWLAGTMFAAGSETTGATLSAFILAMTIHPDVMRRAQAQIDAVIGRERLPTFSDRERLPYIQAIVKEVHRWRPVAPTGLPRRSTQDDWYKGYFLPKGTLVICNVWAINRDPKHFPECDEFRPERYLDVSGKLQDPMADTHSQGHVSYGSGRRICVGKDVANQALFMYFATMLWAFDIEKAVDAHGQTILPPHADSEVVDNGIVVRPMPFKCSITPRSSDVMAIIRSATGGYTGMDVNNAATRLV